MMRAEPKMMPIDIPDTNSTVAQIGTVTHIATTLTGTSKILAIVRARDSGTEDSSKLPFR
ncbi:hypothetical protein GCM10023116_25240 [Kistimonas scapharcae]|uniref:Uncharacterized protein n=1 Tax=Kistimonas scapharcae TaxID=1036133 RepID=A0ABP8V4N7_9GAMM